MSKKSAAPLAVTHPPFDRATYAAWVKMGEKARDYKSGRGAELLARWRANVAWFDSHPEARGIGAL